MLRKIRSTYFSKNVFAYLNEKRKLNLIKYNKRFQNELNISLTNYKLLYGKFIINEGSDIYKIYDAFRNDLIFEGNYKNGIGKEYFKNLLIFEGEYLNGKRNGKGKELDGKYNIICEGVYKNGLRNGKCIEYYSDGTKLTEGEFLHENEWNIKEYDKNGNIINEIKNGKGILNNYDQYDNIIFKGECLNGVKNGKGKEYIYEGKLIFEGEYLNNLAHGRGKKFYNNGQLQLEGEYLYGRIWNIKEYDINNNLIYELKNGKGFIKEFDYDNNIIYEGEYLYGLRNGKGKEYDKDENIKFEGEYLNGLKNGKGKEYNKNGELIFDGEYLYDYRIKGKEYIKGILKFDGKYLYNKKYDGKGFDDNGKVIYELINGNGKVKEYNDNNILIFEGEYLNGLRNGKGKEYEDKVLIFEGEYLNGRKNGYGKEYFNFLGKLKFEGFFLNDMKKGKGIEYDIFGHKIFEGEY